MTETPPYQTVEAFSSVLTGDHKVSNIAFTGPQVAEWLGIPPATWRGWVSKGLAPQADTQLGSKQTPLWSLKTLGEYLKNAPGGRLGYPVG